MFCINCGAQLPDQASFCMKCGKPHRPDLSSVPSPKHERWQYKEFCEDLIPYTSGRKFKSNSTYDSLPYNTTEMNVPINKAVQVLLERVSLEGWEPVEPIDAQRLWNARRVKFFKGRADIFPDPNRYSWELMEVCINFRRLVDIDTLDISKPDSQLVSKWNRELETYLTDLVTQYEHLFILARKGATRNFVQKTGHSPDEWLKFVKDMGCKLETGGNIPSAETSTYVNSLIKLDNFLGKYLSYLETSSRYNHKYRITEVRKHSDLHNTIGQLIDALKQMS